jgi:putative ABC transport system permease protein
MNRWLQNFAYDISIGLWTFLLAAFMTFFVASLTISYQTLRSAAADPVDSLKCE